jgi:hypothetical protein
MNLTQKISQMTPKGADLEATDLIEVSTLEAGSYVTKSITGQELIDAIPPAAATWGSITGTLSSQTDLQSALNAKQDTLTLTTTGTSGAATLVGSTLNIPQYSGGASGNFRRLVASDSGNNTISGTTAETIISSLLIPANSLDALCDVFYSHDYYRATGNGTTVRLYHNTSNSLTGATQIAQMSTGASPRNGGFFRKMLLRGTTLDMQTTLIDQPVNWPGFYSVFAPSLAITFNPAVVNYFITTVQLTTGETYLHKRSDLEKMNLTL